MYFKKFDKEWECEIIGDGDFLDNVAYYSITGRKTKTVIVKINDSMAKEWCLLAGKTKPFVIFATESVEYIL